MGFSSPLSLIGLRDVYLAKLVDVANTVGQFILLCPNILARSVQNNEQHKPSDHLSHKVTVRLVVLVMVGHMSDFLSKTTNDLVLADIRIC